MMRVFFTLAFDCVPRLPPSVRGVMIILMSDDDHHFRREDRHTLWLRIVRHIEQYPDDLHIAMENLDRWLALGRVHPGPIHEWRRRITAARQSPKGMRELLDFMAAPNHDSEPIKSCSPFVGLPLEEPSSRSE